MNWPKGAKVATAALRIYADNLRTHAGTIQTLREMLDANKVSQAVWGVAGFEQRTYHPMGPPQQLAPVPEASDALPALRDFRVAYEIAHAGIIVRMGQLRDLCDNAADALDATAKGYDSVNLTDVDSSGRTAARRDDEWTRPGDDRRSVMDHVPDGRWNPVRELVPRDTLIETGFGDLIPVVDAYLEVDGEALKQIGLMYYGVSDEAIADQDRDENGQPVGLELHPERFIPAPLGGSPSRTEPGQWFLNTAPVPHLLAQVGNELTNRLEEDVEPYWEGDAFESFVEYINTLKDEMSFEAARIRKVGTALHDLGDTLSRSTENVENQVRGAYEKLTAGMDIVNTIKNIDPTWPITQMVEGVLDIYEQEQQESAEKARLTREVDDASVGLTGRAFTAPSPAEVMDDLDFPTDPDEWEWKDASEQ